MSAKDKYMYQRSLASHEGVVCESSTSEEDWRKLKDYFAHVATRLDVKKVNYYVWFDVTLYFMGIKNSTKVCNTKSVIAWNTEKEPTHVSTIVQKRLVNSVFICIDLNIIQWVPDYPNTDYPNSRLSERLDVAMFSAAVGKRRSGHWSSATRESKAAV